MSDPNAAAKVEQPATHFGAPHEVVVDPALSKDEKVKALETLEQDARQLAEASNEGMAGGEPTALHEVLGAKEALALPPVALAYKVVLQDLRARRAEDPDATDPLIDRAVVALEAVCEKMAWEACEQAHGANAALNGARR